MAIFWAVLVGAPLNASVIIHYNCINMYRILTRIEPSDRGDFELRNGLDVGKATARRHNQSQAATGISCESAGRRAASQNTDCVQDGSPRRLASWRTVLKKNDNDSSASRRCQLFQDTFQDA